MSATDDSLREHLHDLYSHHNGWLHGWLRKRLGCAHSAADLTHDVFVRLLGKPMLPPMSDYRPYLARVAHGLLIDQHRRRKVEQAWLDALAAIPEVIAPSPEEYVIIVDALARIEILLDGLKPRVREIFLLSRLEDKSYPVIAQQLSVSVSTVEKAMAQALRHCYQALLD